MVYEPVRQAIFAGLVFDEREQPVETVYVGNVLHYVIVDGNFYRHVEAETIDRQVLGLLRDQMMQNRELVTQGMLSFLGKDDLFTKAMINSSLDHADENMSQLRQQGLPEGVRSWLGMLGFRIVVNIHGEVVRLDSPGIIDEEE
jgi:hypothetical protein